MLGLLLFFYFHLQWNFDSSWRTISQAIYKLRTKPQVKLRTGINYFVTTISLFNKIFFFLYICGDLYTNDFVMTSNLLIQFAVEFFLEWMSFIIFCGFFEGARYSRYADSFRCISVEDKHQMTPKLSAVSKQEQRIAHFPALIWVSFD